MRVLITGANGFIGSHITGRLLAAGHEVIAAVRSPAEMVRRFPKAQTIYCDMVTDIRSDSWLPRLKNIDVVINCAGVLQAAAGEMEAVHFQAPRALFDACVTAGIKRVIQISALGADQQAETIYSQSKKKADDYLRGLDLDWVILQPSLVYATGSYGGSSLFRGLASLPCFIFLPGDGQQAFQPIWIDDLTQTIGKLVESHQIKKQVLTPAGPESVTLATLLTRLRSWLGFSPAKLIAIPKGLIKITAQLGDLLHAKTLNSTAYRMLEYGNTCNPEPFIRTIGFTPLTMEQALSLHPAHVQDRWHARLYFLRPLLRYSLAIVWFASGIIGLLHPFSETSTLLGHLGLPVPWHVTALYTSCFIDIIIGVLLLFNWRPTLLAIAQLLVILVYTTIFSFVQPGLWFDLFGPLLKNIPMAVAILFSMAIADDR